MMCDRPKKEFHTQPYRLFEQRVRLADMVAETFIDVRKYKDGDLVNIAQLLRRLQDETDEAHAVEVIERVAAA